MPLRYISLVLLSLILIVALMPGCKKDPAKVTPTATTASKVKMQIVNSNTGINDTTIFGYDSLGRQVLSQTDTTVTTYTYAAGSVIKNVAIAARSFTTTYTTNTWGRAISADNGYLYQYDANGYLITAYYSAGSAYDSTSYIIANGDVDTSTEKQSSDPANVSVITDIYTYLSTTDSRDFGLAFLGMANKNLIQTQNIRQNINGSIYSESYAYTYTYDAAGRVAKEIKSSGSTTYTTTYSY